MQRRAVYYKLFAIFAVMFLLGFLIGFGYAEMTMVDLDKEAGKTGYILNVIDKLQK